MTEVYQQTPLIVLYWLEMDSSSKRSTSKRFLQMLAKVRLLVNHVTDSLDLIIVKDKNAVGTKQVVT